MSSSGEWSAILAQLEPAFTANLDSIVVVNTKNEIVYANASAKSLLKLKPEHLKNGTLLCDRIVMHVCKDGCQLIKAIETQKTLRADETPCQVGARKYRVTLKAVPLYDGSKKKLLGLIAVLRDTTGEILVQAKYHKVFLLLKEKEAEVASLRDKYDKIRKR